MPDYMPTMRLRWSLQTQAYAFYASPVRIDANHGNGDFYVLQQWWAPFIRSRDSDEIVQWPRDEGEWRDVSLENGTCLTSIPSRTPAGTSSPRG